MIAFWESSLKIILAAMMFALFLCNRSTTLEFSDKIAKFFGNVNSFKENGMTSFLYLMSWCLVRLSFSKSSRQANLFVEIRNLSKQCTQGKRSTLVLLSEERRCSYQFPCRRFAMASHRQGVWWMNAPAINLMTADSQNSFF